MALDPFARRPQEDEYAAFYASYVARAGEGSVLDTLEQQRVSVAATLQALPEGPATYRYAPGKWSINEVVGHLADAERIFGTRAVRILRGDATPQSSFSQNDYAAAGRFDSAPLADLAAEFDLLRRANLAAFRRAQPEELALKGTAAGEPVSVRALLFIMAGHVAHHLDVLADRYALDVVR